MFLSEILFNASWDDSFKMLIFSMEPKKDLVLNYFVQVIISSFFHTFFQRSDIESSAW